MFVRFRSARPTNDLTALRRFYVEALGCAVLAEWLDHEGIDGLVLGPADGAWQVEFIRERGVTAPPAPSHEHLLVFYVEDEATLMRLVDRMAERHVAPVKPNNPYWQRCGFTFADPDGYHVVIALKPPARLSSVVYAS